MNHRIQQFIYRGLIALFLGLEWLWKRVFRALQAFYGPFSWAWRKIVWPPAVWVYKHVVIFTQRWKIFSHSSHRVLSLVTHKWSILAGVAALCSGIAVANVVDASQTKRGPSQFAQGSMIDRVIFRDTDVVVTAKELASAQPQWWQQGQQLRQPLPQEVIIVEEETPIIENAVTGIALVPPARAGKTARTRTEIEEYVVEGGDTAGTIAAKFDLRMQTLLDANDIDDPDLIKPGDTLKILPIDGVKHTWKKKDTLKKVAKRYGADIEDILDFNKLDSIDDIEVGQVLIVPDGRVPEPKPEPVVTPTFTDVAAVTPALQPVQPTVPETTVDTTAVEATPEPVNDEAAAVAEAVGSNDVSAASGNLIWPTITDRISQQYGYGHTGLDIDGEFGDPIYAADNGTVVSAGWAGAYGNMVVVDHGNGVVTRYAHLQSLGVSAGQAVSQGAFLGEEGSTGNSSGSHLHYEVVVDGRFVNPYSQ